MVIDLNKDLIRRIAEARKLFDEVFKTGTVKSDIELKIAETKRRTLAYELQEIGAIVVMHYSNTHTDK